MRGQIRVDEKVKQGKSFFVGLLLVLLSLSSGMLFANLLFGPAVKAQPPATLASTYAPVLVFTSGEKFYPTSVEYILASSVLKQRQPSGSPIVMDPAPTPYTLGTYTDSDLFLDNELGTFEAIASDYTSKAATIGYHAYVRIRSSFSATVVQYWLFYAYNNGPLNEHQGDVEVIQVFLDSSYNPQKALYSQHASGENAVWSDVEKQGAHPIVYVAQGSHANFFRSYQGKIGIENDIVGSDGKTISPSELNLVFLEEPGSLPEQSWLDFPGRWGYWGTDQEAALGRAGPRGPVYNQGGIRWADPEGYMDSTFPVNGTYFILAWITAYLLVLFIAYVVIRATWKAIGIMRLRRKGGLLVGKFLKSGGTIGLVLGIVAILITVVALFLPWYVMTASSQVGALAQEGGVTLLSIDGIRGMQVNLFLGPGGDSTSGYTSLFFMQIPFAILIAVGVILLTLDVVGVKSGKSLGRKLIFGAVTSLLPFILILAFVTQLPAFLPWASSLVPGQGIPPQLESTVRSIAGNPVLGSATAQFPVVGTTTVNWGFGIGAYLFVIAAIVRIVGGVLMRRVPELQPKPSSASPDKKLDS